MIPWQGAAVGVVAGVLALSGTWLHGRSAGVKAERAQALAERAAEQVATIEHMAEVARTMGAAVRMAHERENDLAERERTATQHNRELQAWRARQMAESATCRAWAAAPVGCRLRDPPADGRDGGQAGVPGAASQLPAGGGLGPGR